MFMCVKLHFKELILKTLFRYNPLKYVFQALQHQPYFLRQMEGKKEV